MKPFTIFVPVYNEEEILRQSIETLINYAAGLGVAYEIIAVSNGSSDASVEIGRKLEQERAQVRFFDLPQKGVGRAFKKASAKPGMSM